jgi:DNA-binding response OmpR family regulator
MRAVLRRGHPGANTNASEKFGDYLFQGGTESVILQGRQIELTGKEYSLALTLFRNLGRAISRAYILENVWGYKEDVQTRTLDAHISRIRTKLELRARNGFRVTPVYGYGYRLEALRGVLGL